MIDVEPLIREEFAARDPLPASLRGDWGDVLARVRRPNRRRWRRPLQLAVAAAAAGFAVASAATPLGAAIGRGFDGFSAWLTASPGTPASPQEQQAFEQANARTWGSFPPGTQLRKLIETHASGSTFTLFGFRSGDALCLRLIATGQAAGSTSSCAPLEALQAAKQPALVVASDEPFGTSDKAPGDSGYRPLLASASFGIASDGVRDVILHGDDGDHHALVDSNAFLFVDEQPKLGARIRSADAVAADGATIALPLAAAPYGGNGSLNPDQMGPPQGPTGVDHQSSGGTISWLERGEPRGDALPPDELARISRPFLQSSVTFARAIQPDPANPARVAFLLGRSSGPFRPGTQQLCVMLIAGGGAGGGCGDPAGLFSRQPFTIGVSQASGADQYVWFAGAATDDVAALKIYLANDTILDVPLKDNAFAIQVSRALFPARVVAYDNQGQIIGNELAPTG